MLEKWKEVGLDQLILKAYNDGKIICGLSAGAICWFETMYTDYLLMRGESSEYTIKSGLGVLKGTACPHFNEREKDFVKNMLDKNIEWAYAIENDSAIEFINGEFSKSISSGGKSYKLINKDGQIEKKEI